MYVVRRNVLLCESVFVAVAVAVAVVVRISVRVQLSASLLLKFFRFAPATFYGAGSEMVSGSGGAVIASNESGVGGRGGGHRVIYCVHGKPEGCCARVLSDSKSLNGSSNALPSPPITLCEYITGTLPYYIGR